FLKSELFESAISIFIVLFLLKSAIYFLLKSIRSIGINIRNIMFLGAKSDALQILEEVLRTRNDYGLIIYDYPDGPVKTEELVEFWRQNGIYTLYMPADNAGISTEVRSEICRQAELCKVRIAIIPGVDDSNCLHYELTAI